MRDPKSLSHTRCDCKYHVVFIPKKRRKLIFGSIRKHLREIFHDLARQRGVIIEDGRLMRDHVHTYLSFPPKMPISSAVGFIQGKSAISIARNFKGRQRNFNAEAFWARGHYVSTVLMKS